MKSCHFGQAHTRTKYCRIKFQSPKVYLPCLPESTLFLLQILNPCSTDKSASRARVFTWEVGVGIIFIVLTKSATGRLFCILGRHRGRWTLRFARGALFFHFLLGGRGKGQDCVNSGVHLRHIDLVGRGYHLSLQGCRDRQMGSSL